MKKLLGGLVLSLSMMAGSAQAEAPAKMYFGFGVADSSMDQAFGVDDNMGTLTGTLGFQLLDFVGIELEAGSASDQPSSVLSDPVFTYVAAMVRLGYRWDRAGVYLLGGQVRFDSDGGSSDSENAFGLGVNLFGNETTSLNFHFLRFGDDGDLTTAGIGFQYYFGGFR